MFILDRLIDLVAPFECLLCNQQGSVLCQWCLPDALEVVPRRCYKCCVQSPDSVTCVKCRPKTPLKQVWIATEYSGVAKELVQALKFGHKRTAAEAMATVLADQVPYLPSDTIITHIPTAPVRVRRRGFDHAALIARTFARQRGLVHQTLLSRRGHSRQVGAKRTERIKQLEDAFLTLSSKHIKGKTIVLIDDVLTTGTTMETAARSLKKAGAAKVYAAAFAQKLI